MWLSRGWREKERERERENIQCLLRPGLKTGTVPRIKFYWPRLAPESRDREYRLLMGGAMTSQSRVSVDIGRGRQLGPFLQYITGKIWGMGQGGVGFPGRKNVRCRALLSLLGRRKHVFLKSRLVFL